VEAIGVLDKYLVYATIRTLFKFCGVGSSVGGSDPIG